MVARTADEMIGGMDPVIRPGAFVFVTLGDGEAPDGAVATYREAEGLSAIVTLDAARQAGLPVDQPMRCITLTVPSALDGVGLTAAVAGALAGAGIPCNMVAAFHHDHVYVPSALAGEALRILKALQAARR